MLTHGSPDAVDGSLVGASHKHEISNKYYSATIPVWIDDLQDLDGWLEGFMSDEATEVRDEIACYMLVVQTPCSRERYEHVLSMMKAINKVIGLGTQEATSMLILMPNPHTSSFCPTHDEWEDACMDLDFDFAFGPIEGSVDESQLPGIEHVQQSLELIDWNGRDFDPASDDEPALSYLGGDGDEMASGRLVDSVPTAYDRLQETRESIKRLPDAERRKRAAAAVTEVMNLLRV